MVLDATLEILRGIGQADEASYVIVGVLTLLAFAVMRAMLPVKGLSWVFAPALFWGGLAGIYACRMAGLFYSTEHSTNAAVGAMLGMIAALVVMMVLTCLCGAITARKPRPAIGADPRGRSARPVYRPSPRERASSP
jgi:hypothetical protein